MKNKKVTMIRIFFTILQNDFILDGGSHYYFQAFTLIFKAIFIRIRFFIFLSFYGFIEENSEDSHSMASWYLLGD